MLWWKHARLQRGFAGYHSAVTLTETDLEDGGVVRAPRAPRTTNPEAQATVETTFAVPYAIVGNPGYACDGCQAAYSDPPFGEPGDSFLPNSNVEADAIVSILAHELTVRLQLTTPSLTDHCFQLKTTTMHCLPTLAVLPTKTGMHFNLILIHACCICLALRHACHAPKQEPLVTASWLQT